MVELVLAALSASPSRTLVLGFAQLFASTYGARASALHVAEPYDANTVGEFAFEQDVGLRLVDGDPVSEIVRAARHPRVGLVVVGAHCSPSGRGPGLVTREIAMRIDRPLLVVPREATVPASLDRVLVPLEGTEANTTAIGALLASFPFDPNTELVLLHAFTSNDMPAFANHEPHETDAWIRAFRDRYVPLGVGGDLVMRCDPVEQVVPEVADAVDATLTVVSWSQVLSPGRALLVKALLANPNRPTLLVPDRYRAAPRDAVQRNSGRMDALGFVDVGAGQWPLECLDRRPRVRYRHPHPK